MPRAKNAIKFVKERVRCIQSETPFMRSMNMLTIEMVKWGTVLVNSFDGKSGVHAVVSPIRLLFGKKFEIPLCKIIGKVVMIYKVIANNTTARPWAFFAL